MASAEERYTPRLREALVFASQEAIRLRHHAVTPEHIVLGLIREGTGLATTVLGNLGVDTSELRASIEAKLKPGQQAVRGEVEYGAEAKQATEVAALEAEALKCHYVGQEHVLLAILRQDDGQVAKLLRDSDVTYAAARSNVFEILYKSDRKGKVKRYNLALPEDLFREVEELADREHTTVLEVIRRSVKLGLLVAQVQRTPGASFIIREGATERQLVLL